MTNPDARFTFSPATERNLWIITRTSDGATVGYTRGNRSDAKASALRAERETPATTEHDGLCFCVECLSRTNTNNATRNFR